MSIKTKITSRRVLLIACLLGLFAAPLAMARDFYVDQNHPEADDGNPGTFEQPWKTLKRAAKEDLQPGDTVHVQPGVYDASGGAWNKPVITSRNSGTAPKPITFRSVKRHGAVLDAKGDDGPIGSRRDYVVIDGFEVINVGEIGVVLFGERGSRIHGPVVQNMKIHGIHGGAGNNTDGIRVENTSGALIRNNLIYDITNEARSSNAAGVKIYYSDNLVVEHNEIYDVIAGIKDKEEGQENHIRFNYIHDCSQGMELMNQNDTITAGYYFYQNIVANCGTGFESHTNPSAVMRKVRIFNNLFYNYRNFGVQGTVHGSDRQVFNNIFVRSGEVVADISSRQDPPAEFTLIDNNLFSQEPKLVVGLYSTDRVFRGLDAWRKAGFGFGQSSTVADPKFVNPAAGDFRPVQDSPVRGMGRSVAGSGSVNVGPYMRGNEVIGLVADVGGPLAKPKAPTGLVVQ